MKKILYSREIVQILAKTFDCTRQTVCNAMRGKFDTDLARRIRKRALDMGMKEIGEENIKYL